MTTVEFMKLKIPDWSYLFKRQSHKTVKHTQIIRRQIADKLFECVWPFCEIGAKRVTISNQTIHVLHNIKCDYYVISMIDVRLILFAKCKKNTILTY